MPTGTPCNISKEFLIEEYVNKKKSAERIAKEIGCVKKTVLLALETHNIEKRRRQDYVKYNDLTGQTFNRLYVIKYIGRNRHNQPEFLCRCECGNEKKIRSDSITTGHTKSCGCDVIKNGRKNRKCAVGDIPNSFWNKFYNGAILRGKEWSITPEYLWETYKNQNGRCAISGVELSFDKGKVRGNASLDRIDNSKGYIEGNIWIISKTLNLMKGELDLNLFIHTMKTVVRYQDNKDNFEPFLWGM